MGWVSDFASIYRGYIDLPFNPFLYVALLLLWIQYVRQNRVERNLFGQRLTSSSQMFIRSILYGFVAGGLGTVVINALGIVLSQNDMILLWVITVMLSIFEARFLCFAYAGGLLGLISFILKQIPIPTVLGGPIAELWTTLRGVSIYDILMLVAVLHVIEACLIWLQGYQNSLPVFVASRRGKIVGGFVLQNVWMIPLLSFIGLSEPSTVFGTIAMNPPLHDTILSAQHSFQTFLLVPLPVMLGFSTITLTRHAKEKASQSATRILLYALGLIILILLSLYKAPFLWAACVYSFVVHDWMIRADRKKEQTDTPIFVKPLRGLKLLTVFPQSPADSMGLKAGDTIVRVNGIPVNTTYEFHFAISQNPAYVKLDVMDEAGEIRFTGKPLYAGDPHQLGVILVPDDHSLHYVTLYSSKIWSFLKWLKQPSVDKRKPYVNRQL